METDTALDTREDRRSALDDFAREGDQRRSGEVLAMSAFGPPTDRVFGAQQVAVMRDESKALAKLKALAAAAGTDWYYRYPVRNKKQNRTDWIEGPSIKLANDLARIYGNCDVDTRVQDLGDSWLYYARFMDLETGFSLTRPFQQRKSAGKIGGDDDARRLDIAFQIGASKAIRNVVVNALQTFADYAFEEAKNALVDKIGKDLPAWRERIAERTKAHVDIKRVEAVLGRTVDDWLAPDIARVIAMMKAVSDGMATMDETFPPLDKGGDGDKTASDAGAKNGKQAKPDMDDFAKDEAAEKQRAEGKSKGEAKAGKQADQPAQSKPETESDPDPQAASGGGSGNGAGSVEKPSSGSPAPDNPEPGDGAPSEADARAAGAKARADQMNRKAVPAAFRKEPLLSAWQDGFDSGEAEDREPGADG